MLVQFLLRLERQAAHLPIIQVPRERLRVEAPSTHHLLLLAFDVSSVLSLHFDLRGDYGIHTRRGHQTGISNLWTSQNIKHALSLPRACAYKRGCQALGFGNDCVPLPTEGLPPSVV